MNLTDMATFFLIYPVGLEDLGQREIETKFTDLYPNDQLIIKSKMTGGLEIECQLQIGFKLNYHLKTPTRILLRLTQFKCRDFPKLYQKISKFNWAPWLLGNIPEVECSSKNSRLFDSRKIEKAIGDGIAQFYRHKPVKKKYLEHESSIKDKSTLPKIYFRVEDDTVTLSLDTTGEKLHLRGEKLMAGLAPIRETLASLLLLELDQHVEKKPYTLIDPMCGSGTFLIEARHFYQPSLERDYAFKHLPLVIEVPNKSLEETQSIKSLALKTVGFDISAEVIAQAKRNDSFSEYHVEDLMTKTQHLHDNAVVIVNPPYGIRVGENINIDFFLRVLRSIREKFHPQLTGIIVPAEFKIFTNQDWQVIKTRPFKNGGIDVIFYLVKFQY